MQRSAAPELSSRHASRSESERRVASSSVNAAAVRQRAAPALHGAMRTRPRGAQPAGVFASAMKTSRWKAAYELLVSRNVKGVSASEAANLMRWPRSYVLVDVRRTDQFAAFHATGSRNAALYRLIQPSSPWQVVRAAAFQAQNVDPVEDNPEATELLRAALAGTGGVIFTDAEGGSLISTPQRPYGLVSRSLLGAYQALAEVGYKGTVLHLEGGLNAWFAAGLSGEGDEEAWTFSGKTPSSAAFAPRQQK